MEFNIILDISVFVAFVAAVVFVGLYKGKNKGGSEDYFLAGRGLSWWLIGISLIAANISTEQFVGMSGSASGLSGLAIASYEWMAAVVLVVVAFFFLPIFLKSGMYTVPQFLEYRFDATSRTVMSVMMVVVLVSVNTTAVIYSGATVANTVFGSSADLPFDLDLTVCCWAIGIIAAIYVCAGGLKACAWADLLQGSALIIGGMLITYFAFSAFAGTPVEEISTTATLSPQDIANLSDAGVMKKFFTLNSDKLTMFMPADHPEIPWTALIIGLWIPNFYYWGFNQYIIQRTLGASSLAEGQKGVIFAAGLKLIIPFIIVFPGIVAFNIYAQDQHEAAIKDSHIMATNAKTIAPLYFNHMDAMKLNYTPEAASKFFSADMGKKDKAGNPVKTQIFTKSELDTLHSEYENLKKTGAIKKLRFEYDKGWATNGGGLKGAKELVDQWNKASASEGGEHVTKKLYGYKYDSAFGLLISKALPQGFGLRGFIFAALLGAVVSSLAAMLNAASTIFTIDIYKKFINKHASDKNQVIVGRVTVLVFAAIGCIVAPMLANPKLGGVFTFIQEFQGYLSPGILAVFIFGMFSKKAPRFAGALGILTSPIVYGILQAFFGDIAFLNRMAITFACSLAVMLLLTLVKPLKQDVVLPVNEKMDLRSSRSAEIAGVGVLIVVFALYFTFSGLWF